MPRKPSSRYGRPQAKRNRTKRILVVTNGEVTETGYCDILNDELKESHITYKVKSVDPRGLAQFAVSKKDEDLRLSRRSKAGKSDPYSRVYVITDVDDFPDQSFHEARKTCDEEGMQLIVSNPCFEVWIIDHVMQCPTSIQTTPQAERFAANKGLTMGKGHKYLATEKLRGKATVAANNAERHNEAAGGACGRLRPDELRCIRLAPWTDMPELIHALLPT